jgi:hypothetical protein
MPQIFSHRADYRLRFSVAVAAVALLVGGAVAFVHVRSAASWAIGEPAAQPIPFSHAVHAGSLGLDCRFCHAGVERAASAGMPTAETCLGCHRSVWPVGPQLAPLTTALVQEAPVVWSSVHRLPDHVRFHHAAHWNAGIGCQTCHGAVGEMARTVKTETLSMGWCLGCHRQTWADARGGEDGRMPMPPATIVHQGIAISSLTRCSTCHR